MKTGKIPPEILQKTILPFTGARRKEVLVGPKFGEDCAVLDLGEELLVLSTDPITGATAGLGRLAVHVSCNDVAATGAEPVGILFTLLLPPGTGEDFLAPLIQEIHHTAAEINVAVLGGHTEITPVVNQVVVSATAVGKVTRENLVTSSGARPGDDIILTKSAGLEGTAILAGELAPLLAGHLSPEILAGAQALGEQLSVIPEGTIAAGAGATAMHDVTEGGVRGALVELATASGVGLEVWEEAIPVAPETRALCRYLDIDPLGLISSGALLITAPPKSQVMAALAQAGIPAHIIGRTLSRPEFFLVLKNGERRTLTAPERDELYKALEKHAAPREG
ncbi:MAG: AIR synthase family protein [bacterium]